MRRDHRSWMTLAALTLAVALTAAPAAAQTCSADADDVFAAMEAVAALDVPVENALLVELASAMTGLATGDTEAAIADLESFINKVEAKVPNQIDPADAAELIAFAESVINAALCPCGDLWNGLLADLGSIGLDPVTDAFKIHFPGVSTDIRIEGGDPLVSITVGTDFGEFCGAGSRLGSIPPTFVLVDTQEEFDACEALILGYHDDFNCPPGTGTGYVCSP